MKTVGYVRVSTDEQASTGVSLDAQEDRIRAFCIAKEWELVSVVRDEGRSAKNLKRDGLQVILNQCKQKNRSFNTVIVTKLDRLTRSVTDLGYLNKFFQKHKIAFTSIDENVDTSSATGELYLNIVASISQWERKKIGERTKEALAFKKSRGERVGTIPYGYRFGDDGKTLIKVEEGQLGLTKIKRLRDESLSCRRVAEALNREGVRAKSGGQWYAKTVRGVLCQSYL
jgi:site-specific DNA recombinase